LAESTRENRQFGYKQNKERKKESCVGVRLVQTAVVVKGKGVSVLAGIVIA
jgi:hypothetical protein